MVDVMQLFVTSRFSCSCSTFPMVAASESLVRLVWVFDDIGFLLEAEPPVNPFDLVVSLMDWAVFTTFCSLLHSLVFELPNQAAM